ncbi:oxidoreductase [Waterburya agarophytonicola K14]|uniref:Oxidoreductase n=1 Tax=Waterburya agarophytonicola KI4 TaxID=2874699 RepID=A0A964FIE5_9CYAN|nr:oxidoreductase [Waterburya agarophytonicola]MCC0179817.1 oxidoreductase [Waterburya agarophytonicola KI4]
MKNKVTNVGRDRAIEKNQPIMKRRKEKIKVHHSLMEFYTDTGLIDEYRIEVDYSNDNDNQTYGVTEEEIDDPKFWLDL